MENDEKLLSEEEKNSLDNIPDKTVSEAEQTEPESKAAESATEESETKEPKTEESEDKADEKKSKKEKKAKKPKKEKTKKNKKRLKHGSMAIVFTVVFVAALVLVNLVATKLFERFPLSFDMTSNSAYSISDETIEYVKDIDVNVKVTVLSEKDEFENENVYTLQASEILQKYAQYNSKIEIEYIDFLSNPDIVSEYDDDLSEYDIIFETSQVGDNGDAYKRTSVVSPLDLVNFSSDITTSVTSSGYTLEEMAQSYGSEMTFISSFASQTYTNSSDEKVNYIESSNAEQAFTSALMVVTDANPTKIVLLTGRSELTSLTYYQTLMKANGYVVESIDITTDDIPDDANLAVIAAPSVDYTEEEVTKVADFLNNDGKLDKNVMYIASVSQPDTPNLDEFLAEYGIVIEDAMMYDSNSDNASGYYLKLDMCAEDYESYIKDDSLTLLTAMFTKPITLSYEEQDMRETVALLKTANTGYQAGLEDGEEIDGTTGEQTAAAIGYKAVFNDDNTTSYSQVLVLGSEYILNDSILQAIQYVNSQWILSVTNTVTGKTSTGITIEPAKVGGSLFELTNTQISIYKWIFNLGIPVIVGVVGIVVWRRRKNR